MSASLQVAKPHKAPQVLQGNAGEVTGVAWCPTDATQLVTCHDNATVNVWTLDRSRDSMADDEASLMPLSAEAYILFICQRDPTPQGKDLIAEPVAQEPVLAPVTPGAMQHRKQRFGALASAAGPPAQRRSSLHAALEHAAEEGMQRMQCHEHSAAPAQQPCSAPGRAREDGAMLLPSDSASQEGEAARSGALAGSALKQAEGADQPWGLAEQQTAQTVDHKLNDGQGTARSEANSGQGHTASARPGIEDATARQQDAKSTDLLSQAAAEQQQNKGVAAMCDHDLDPDDGLPLNSLFASGHPGERIGQPAAQPGLQHSHLRDSQPASQDSNQENRLPDAGENVQR